MTAQHAKLLSALATELSMNVDDPRLAQFCLDLAEIMPDWFSFYLEESDFHGQALLDYKDGHLDVFSFALRRKSKRPRQRGPSPGKVA